MNAKNSNFQKINIWETFASTAVEVFNPRIFFWAPWILPKEARPLTCVTSVPSGLTLPRFSSEGGHHHSWKQLVVQFYQPSGIGYVFSEGSPKKTMGCVISSKKYKKNKADLTKGVTRIQFFLQILVTAPQFLSRTIGLKLENVFKVTLILIPPCHKACGSLCPKTYLCRKHGFRLG